jgi:parvulin-like peptidyl-prolyl isomerase
VFKINTPTIKKQKKWKIALSNKIKCSHILVEKQSESLAILEKIKGGEKFGN